MRRCIVESCTSSDHIVLCHRFPKNRTIAQKWQHNLGLTEWPLETLISKYTVCCRHFDSSDYRNSITNSLNSNAVPKLIGNNHRRFSTLKNKKSPTGVNWSQADEEQPAGSPVNFSDSIELLHDDTDDATEVDDNLISPQYSSDDVCILPEEQNAADALIQSLDGAGFTILDVAACTNYAQSVHEVKNSNVSDGSTSSSSDCRNNLENLVEFRENSTDSEVEVLVSESLYGSQLSETNCSSKVLNVSHSNTSDDMASPCVSCKSDLSNKTNEDSKYSNFTRSELIDIIRKQSNQIEELENKLNTFMHAHEQFVGHFDDFRNIVCDMHV